MEVSLWLTFLFCLFFKTMNLKQLKQSISTAALRRRQPEAVCDGRVLFHVHREIQEILVFAAHLSEEEEK